ncbi:MAG: hypothetical protein QS748_05300 [Candidatus Endonucleobacter bathymodioli]|uniref:Uncharacterized protein n=1 Tax=Candidatus Endonucleibacter bathymodioli TaxID=539814 RepID=A0AA90SCY8_9GAMM|nr:hypothetical protein [Candidatus Endonucleobacter bathymodioli]
MSLELLSINKDEQNIKGAQNFPVVVQKFSKEMNEIIAFMILQERPFELKFAKKGSKISTDVDRAYTRSGQYVEFTVWPSSYLHKGGPLLSKGVVQPKVP